MNNICVFVNLGYSRYEESITDIWKDFITPINDFENIKIIYFKANLHVDEFIYVKNESTIICPYSWDELNLAMNVKQMLLWSYTHVFKFDYACLTQAHTWINFGMLNSFVESIAFKDRLYVGSYNLHVMPYLIDTSDSYYLFSLDAISSIVETDRSLYGSMFNCGLEGKDNIIVPLGEFRDFNEISLATENKQLIFYEIGTCALNSIVDENDSVSKKLKLYSDWYKQYKDLFTTDYNEYNHNCYYVNIDKHNIDYLFTNKTLIRDIPFAISKKELDFLNGKG